MEGEQPTIAAAAELASPPALDAPVSTEETNTDEPTRIPSPEEVNEEQQAAAEGQVEDDSVEIEWDDGKKYKIPKAVEAGILRNKDYTQKRQADAEFRKTLEAREGQIEERLKATDEELGLRAQSRHIDSELERFKDFTWEAYQAALRTDPLAAEEARAYVQHLREQKAGITDQLKTAESKRSETAQQDFAKRVQETLAEAPKIIPGSTPETAGKSVEELVNWANSRGIPEQTLKANWSPTLLSLLYDAKLGHGLRTKTITAPTPSLVPKPLETVSGRKSAPTSGDLASLDMDAYVAARKKGVGGKALR